VLQEISSTTLISLIHYLHQTFLHSILILLLEMWVLVLKTVLLLSQRLLTIMVEMRKQQLVLAYVGNLYPSYMRLMNGPYNDIFNGDTRADSGFLGEVLLYNRILNSNELLNTHTYLLNKWGISTIISNVPVTRGLNLWLDCV
jgi:hypothetical protein